MPTELARMSDARSSAPPVGPGAFSPNLHVVSRSYDDYVASITHASLSGYILARETRPWELHRHRVGAATLERGEEGASFVAAGTTRAGNVSFYLGGAGAAPRFVNGHEIRDGALVRWGGGTELSVNVPVPGEWWALTVPSAAWTHETGRSPDVAQDRGEPPPVVGLDLPPGRLERLRSLLRGAFEAIDATGPEGLHPAASVQLERTLLGELSRASGEPGRLSKGAGRPRISRHRVLGRLHELLASRPSEPLYVADLCTATGLSERTLRHVVVEQYGMSPMRLLRSRRLCQLREALRDSSNGADKITAIAGRHGFWHMGQLAADYRRLFGELPSETARRVRPRA